MNSTTPWRTLLVDDETLLRNALTKALSLDPRFEIVGELGEIERAKELCVSSQPHLVVTEIQMKGTDGLEFANFCMKNALGSRVLMLSHLKDAFTLNRVCESRVHGYVEKDQPWEILEEALVEVASGRTYFTATAKRCQEQLRSNPNAFSKVLNLREQAILGYVATGLTSKVIAERLNLTCRSVETYRYRMMKKLGTANLAELMEYAFRHGFVRPGSRSLASTFADALVNSAHEQAGSPSPAAA
jgi:DNA-binding NarL/FixJ family response regulator